MAESHGASYSGGMNKARKYDIANTNIAMLGTDLEKAVRQAAAEGEPAWNSIHREKPGLQVWRIEKFNVASVNKKDYGHFYDGDSYIILHKYHKDGNNGAMQFDIHFWIGSQSSQDEYGTAAYKTVELDDFLSGIATQYREVQGRESRRFKAIFPNMLVMEGGIDSGFRHVKPKEYRKRLLHVKGKLNTVAFEVTVSLDSLNSGDSFVFDAGLRIYVWHGKDAGIMEKTKAANLAQAFGDDRGGAVVREVYDQDDRDEGFFRALGIKKGSIKSKEEGGSDDQVQLGTKRLLRVSDSSGNLEMTEVATGDDIRRDQLDSKDVFILDDGYEVMVWVGLGASHEERRRAMNTAANYLKKYDRPMDTPISKVLEGGENELFEAAFEVGVKTGSSEEAIRAASRTKDVAASAQATYKGSGGPGVVADMDALYNQNGVDPNNWGGRSKAPGLYALELQSKGLGAYSPASGWVSGMTQRERQLKQDRINVLQKQMAANVKSREAAGGSQLGTVQPAINFSSSRDAQTLRKAIKGLGTNEKKVINILGRRSLDQRQQIVAAYSAEFERDLVEDMRRDTGGNFRTLCLALLRTEPERYAELLRKGVKGWGTDERLLIDILCTKESDQIFKIHEAYHAMYDRSLEDDIIADTSGDFKRLLVELLKCDRTPLETPVNADQVKADAQTLYDAGEARWGTDESKFIEILTKRSFPHIGEVVHAYNDLQSGRTLQEALKSELGFDFKNACLAIVQFAVDPTEYVCDRLYHTMKGWGTSDKQLINLVVEHCEVDMSLIKERFPARVVELSDKADQQPVYLHDMIHGDTSGNYRKLLMTLIGER